MKTYSFRILLFAGLLICLYSCDGDTVITDSLNTKSISIDGFITDEEGHSVVGASIEFGLEKLTSNADGYFQIPSAKYSDKIFIKVNKQGYFTGSRTLFLDQSKSAHIHISLLQKSFSKSFQASSGGSLDLDGKIKLQFPAQSIMDNNGLPYNGNVNVAIQYLDPSNNTVSDIMPGNLVGLNANGQLQSLGSYAMAAIELQSPSGQQLQIKTGNEVTIKMRIPESLRTHAPGSIPLWYFDETKGLWIEEGSAVKTGIYYEGKVKHFSFWNCDDPFPTIRLKGTLVDGYGNAIDNAAIKLTIISSDLKSFGYTNREGIFEGAVPLNETMIMEVFEPCKEVLYTSEIGPFTENTDLGQITILKSINNLSHIDGKVVDSKYQAIPFIKLMIKGDNQNFGEIRTNQEGEFYLPKSFCEIDSITISVYDLCDNQVYNHNFATMNSNGNLGQLMIPTGNFNLVSFNGTVTDSKNRVLKNSPIQIISGQHSYQTNTDQFGVFHISIPLCNSDSISISTIDLCNNFVRSRNISSSNSNGDLGQVEIMSANFEPVIVSGKLLDSKQEALQNVSLLLISGQQSFKGKTNQDGVFTVSVSYCNTDSIFILVYDLCDEIAFRHSIGIINTEGYLGQFVVSTGAFESVPVDGQVTDCLNHGLQNVSIKIISGNRNYITITNQQGKFSIPVAFCNTNTISITAYDPSTYVYSKTYNYDLPGPIHTLPIQICKALSEEYLNVEFSDGTILNYKFNLELEDNFGVLHIFTNTNDPWFELKWEGIGSLGGKTSISEISCSKSAIFYSAKYHGSTNGYIVFSEIPKSTGAFYEGVFEGLEINKLDIKSGNQLASGIKVNGSFKVRRGW